MEIVAAQTGHILDDHPLDLARLDVGKHPLEARTVEICPRITVVLVVVPDGGIAMVAAILLQNLLLVDDAVAFAVQLITSVVKDRKVSGDEKSRTRDGDDAAISA